MSTDPHSSASSSADSHETLLYVSRAHARGVAEPVAHAIFGRVFEPELTLLPPAQVATDLTGAGLVRVRALDQLVLALAG